MSTARSRTIEHYRSGEQYPITGHNGLDLGHHYAHLGRIINPAVRAACSQFQEKIVLSTIKSADVLKVRTKAVFRDATDASMRRNKPLAKRLKADHDERRRSSVGMHATLHSSLHAGIENAVESADDIVRTLRPLVDSDVIVHPRTSGVLYDLGRLSMDHFIPYRETYLRRPHNHRLFFSHLLLSDDTFGEVFANFRPHFPDEAPVTVGAYQNDLHVQTDYQLDSQPTIQLENIPLSRDAIGCPITFDRDTTELMWVAFATTRILFD